MGVLVIDYKNQVHDGDVPNPNTSPSPSPSPNPTPTPNPNPNQVHDGDFAPNPACYPSVHALSDGVRSRLNASTVFSFWPEVLAEAAEFATLRAAGCLINADLGGKAVDPTLKACRELIWSRFLRPRYYAQGVTAY